MRLTEPSTARYLFPGASSRPLSHGACPVGQVPQNGAATTEAIRRVTLRTPPKREGMTPMTAATPKYSSAAADRGAKTSDPCSTVLSPQDHAIEIALRRPFLRAWQRVQRKRLAQSQRPPPGVPRLKVSQASMAPGGEMMPGPLGSM